MISVERDITALFETFLDKAREGARSVSDEDRTALCAQAESWRKPIKEAVEGAKEECHIVLPGPGVLDAAFPALIETSEEEAIPAMCNRIEAFLEGSLFRASHFWNTGSGIRAYSLGFRLSWDERGTAAWASRLTAEARRRPPRRFTAPDRHLDPILAAIEQAARDGASSCTYVSPFAAGDDRAREGLMRALTREGFSVLPNTYPNTHGPKPFKLALNISWPA